MNSQYAATLSLKTNQANMTDYDIRANSLVLVGCLAKRKRPINRRVQKRLDVERFHHFGTVFVNEDRETEAVFVYATKSQRPTRQSQRLRLCRAIKSRTRATKSRNKIAGVTWV